MTNVRRISRYLDLKTEQLFQHICTRIGSEGYAICIGMMQGKAIHRPLHSGEIKVTDDVSDYP
jgi:hypothetical protein